VVRIADSRPEEPPAAVTQQHRRDGKIKLDQCVTEANPQSLENLNEIRI
jgi:hypothetical protein